MMTDFRQSIPEDDERGVCTRSKHLSRQRCGRAGIYRGIRQLRAADMAIFSADRDGTNARPVFFYAVLDSTKLYCKVCVPCSSPSAIDATTPMSPKRSSAGNRSDR
jgi:hypothetical protein